MTNKITTFNTGTMAGSVFFGTATLQIHGKGRHQFNVSNHLHPKEEYEFRQIAKTRAGWNTIFDFKAKPSGIWYHIGKTTQCVQVKLDNNWFDIYISKGGIWASVDVALLDLATVSDIYRAAPKMADYNTWKRLGAETHADLAFCPAPCKHKNTHVAVRHVSGAKLVKCIDCHATVN